MRLATPPKLSVVSVLVMSMTDISRVASFTVVPSRNIPTNINVRPMINLPTIRLPSTNINGGSVCALNMGESLVEGESSDIAARIAAADKDANARLWDLVTKLQSTDEIWADINTCHPVYNENDEMVGKSNMLDHWNELGAVMYSEASKNESNETQIELLKGYSRSIMAAASKYDDQQDAPDRSALIGVLSVIDFGFERYGRIINSEFSDGPIGRGIIKDVADAGQDVEDYINDLVTDTQTTSDVWDELQGSNGKFNEWYDLGADMIAEALHGARPIKLAKCGTVVQNTCSTNTGQPVPSEADLITTLMTIELSFENYQRWYS